MIKEHKKFKLKNIFSISNVGIHKQINLCGLKLKFKSKKLMLKNNVDKLQEQLNLLNDRITGKINVLNPQEHNYTKLYILFMDILIKNRLNKKIGDYNKFITDLFNNRIVMLASWKYEYNEVLNYYKILFNKAEYVKDKNMSNSTTNVFWGSQVSVKDNVDLLFDSFMLDKEYVFAEMGFIHRIAFPNPDCKYSNGISFMFDDIAPYYDARYPNRLEMMLNDKSLIITDEQKLRARVNINKIVSNHLTKYNHQPIYSPNIGREGVKKVLVVDQSYGDMSIAKGLANDETFKNMLDCAIKENPDADIIVKTHPDTIAGAGGYYKGLKAHDNIYTQTEPINPISLIQYVDKVYVCTTQFGFEALMCGKEVHVFGMPFYAGWGLTLDRQKCSRRTNTRSLEEIFYITYIMYSYYVNPDKKCRCEIEEAEDYLLKLRDEYFKEKEKKCQIKSII